MTAPDPRQSAELFRSLHHGELLVLPNAWDALSARVFAEAGCQAVATTSAGVSWSLGYPDGEQVPWREFIGATCRMARAVSVPLTVDFEGGFSRTTQQLAERVREVIAAGAAGINLEDSSEHQTHTLMPADVATKRIAVVRETALQEGVPIVINARTDSFLHAVNGHTVPLGDVIQRCREYLAAGADCVYPIGLADIQLIGQLVKELRAPVNITGRPGGPTLQALRAVGVARVSTAVSPALHMAGVLLDDIVKLKETGSFEHFASPFNYPRMQQMFAAGD